MGAGASIANVDEVAALDAGKQREASDALFDKLDVITDGNLNMMELKKGFKQLAEEGVTIKLPYTRFAKIADTDGNKVVDKEEFFAVMTKVFAKGDVEIGDAPPPVVQAELVTTAEGAGEVAMTSAEDPMADLTTTAVGDSSGVGAGVDVASRAGALFLAIDLNGNGSLSLSELATFLGPDASEVLAEFDPDGSKGAVDLASWSSFFAGMEEAVASGFLMTLEGAVVSKDLSKAAPPASTGLARGDDAAPADSTENADAPPVVT
jgi:hypothetical protein